jgi:hypothetical protein
MRETENGSNTPNFALGEIKNNQTEQNNKSPLGTHGGWIGLRGGHLEDAITTENSSSTGREKEKLETFVW